MLIYISIAVLALLVLLRVILSYEHRLCLILLEWLQTRVERRYKAHARVLQFLAPPASSDCEVGFTR